MKYIVAYCILFCILFPEQLYSQECANCWVKTKKSFLKSGSIVDESVVCSDMKVVVGIGLKDDISKYQFAVGGALGATRIEVKSSFWPDLVFEEDYELRSLEQVEQFVIQNKHLPDVPSEKTVIEHGIDLGSMDAILLQKIEELTLYIIEQDKRMDSLSSAIKNFQIAE